jgi:beta-galactosidase
VLLAPGLYVASDALLDRLEAYARAGGHLVLGIRSGYADDEARARHEVMPGRLRAAAGVTYNEYTNLGVPVPLTAPEAGEVALTAGASGTAWADALVPEGADTLVGYDHPHLGRWAAVTTHAHGRGRVTYVGTLPDRALAVALARWLRPTPDDWQSRPDTVTVTGARNPAGGHLRFVSNWSWEPASMRVPVGMRDVLSGTRIGRDKLIDLEPWDVRVLAEEARTQNEGGSTP